MYISQNTYRSTWTMFSRNPDRVRAGAQYQRWLKASSPPKNLGAARCCFSGTQSSYNFCLIVRDTKEAITQLHVVRPQGIQALSYFLCALFPVPPPPPFIITWPLAWAGPIHLLYSSQGCFREALQHCCIALLQHWKAKVEPVRHWAGFGIIRSFGRLCS